MIVAFIDLNTNYITILICNNTFPGFVAMGFSQLTSMTKKLNLVFLLLKKVFIIPVWCLTPVPNWPACGTVEFLWFMVGPNIAREERIIFRYQRGPNWPFCWGSDLIFVKKFMLPQILSKNITPRNIRFATFANFLLKCGKGLKWGETN